MCFESVSIASTNPCLGVLPQQIAAEQQQAQQQQLIQSLGPAALGSKLLDPKNNAQAQQLTEELNANQEAA